MYFEDLSAYRYGLSQPLDEVQNVGWLCRGTDYKIGGVMPGFIDALKRWASYAEVNQMRGHQLCTLCPAPASAGSDPVSLLKRDVQMSTMWSGETLWLGASEIWIPNGQGGVYAAPSLIIHYVEAHHYLPPSEFIEAAFKPIPSGWEPNRLMERLINNKQ